MITDHDEAIERAARALHDEDIRTRAVEMAYPECADYYRERVTLVLETVDHSELVASRDRAIERAIRWEAEGQKYEDELAELSAGGSIR